MAEFKNPNQQGGGDNKSLLVMMLVLVTVFFGLQYFRSKNNPQTASPNVSQSTATVGGTQAPAQTPASPAVTNSAAAAPAASGVPTVQAPAEATTTVENELYRITFTNRGGQVSSWILKKYKDSDGKPLNLVHTQAAQQFGYPLSLYTYDAALTASLSKALYVPSASGALAAPASLTFNYSDGATTVRKTFSFDETYVLHADVEVTRNGAPVRALINWPGGFGDQDNASAYAGAQLDYAQNAKEQHLAAKKVSGGETLNGPFDWAGTSDTYFAAIFLPDSPDTATVAMLHNQLDVAKTIRRTGLGSGAPAKGAIEVPVLGAALGDTSGRTQTRVYVGPKAVNVLRGIHATGNTVSLEPLLDFGFFGPIGKYLFLSLQFIHAHITSNWGWSIVLLTVLINLLILPLRVKTMQSGLKMQRIQPQMDAIKERYKKYKATDPKRNEMNVEIMKLQKDNGVNMFGGCIPTLIQMPLLFAFFSMLPKVVELRQAHWFWLPDLSSADPYHILPIVMIVSQFLVQFYTPSPGVDPQQQKMMAFMMPAVSGYMTWNYASGLALYWTIGNLISIAQQSVMNRTSLGREMREIAAKRARRKAGTPTTISGKR
ncbi:membrane protein insertase YidC [Tunturiibacter gelidoferens]|uniref:YidC/Oxa1 family membrane protein insertase n=1 Tax=Tunturiibacter gelidiferens TaxID=3069689 RepID=A0ACC5P1D9_9BACT|nr:membrane protein insertase YidC [Edaphobacter lichenicola]MBB5340665.1 YidC/Oxa1 family membrane protein insertase [Edaphobacter lichenicola]